MKFIEFTPLYKERVWGGNRLHTSLKRTLPDDQPYGESWEIVDREEDQSIVAQGPWKNLTLRQLLEQQSPYIMSPEWPKDKKFPILVKWLDCRERLSVQVHPPKTLQSRLKGESKTENWYIAEADPNASVYAGLHSPITPEAFLKAIENGNPEPYLHRIKTQKGDSLFIPSGRLHAIAEGNLILEIQENSDTTYRVYDWKRLGLDGKPRELHIKESLMSIDFQDVQPEKVPASNSDSLLADSPEFRIQKVFLHENSIEIKANEQPRILSVVDGTLTITDSDASTLLNKGSNILLPFSESFILESPQFCTLLIIDFFI